MMFHIENRKNFTKKLLEINTVNLQDTKAMYKNLLCSYILTITFQKTKQNERKIICNCNQKNKISRYELNKGERERSAACLLRTCP